MGTGDLLKTDAAARADLVSAVRYKVSLDLSDDLSRTTYSSTTVVDFEAAQAAQTFLDLKAAGVRELDVNGRRVPVSAFDGDRISIDVQPGHNTVRVVADCEYTTIGVGLHRKADPSDGRVYLYSHFEPFDAHRVYACFDQPDIKAAVTVDLTGPDNWVLSSNQDVVEPGAAGTDPGTVVTSAGPGRRNVQFSTTKPLPPYLTAFGAGEYHVLRDSYKSLPLVLVARQSQTDVLDKMAPWMFDATKELLAAYEKAFGFPYQFRQYGQAFVPEFNAGAMENPGWITFNDAMIPRGKVGHNQRRRLYEVIAHEMAHACGFGDVTTMKWWDDLHLNETFATFMSYYVMGQSNEFAGDAWVEFALTEKTMALRQDQLSTTHPVKAKIDSTEEVALLFDQITYAKGASVIRQLYALIGEKAFFKGLRAYFASPKHWFGNATQADFLEALGAASGRDLTQWGQQWMGTAGVNTLTPSLTVRRDGRITALTVAQTAIPSQPTLRTHRVNIGLYDLDASGRLVLRDSVPVEVSGAATQVSDPRIIGAKRPALMLVNDGDLTYAKVRFDKQSIETLRTHIGEIQDPMARAVCWTALWDMTRDAQMTASDYVSVVARQCALEDNLAILERQINQALQAANDYAAPEHRAGLMAQLADTARDAVGRSGAGSELQLTWLRAYIASAQRTDQLDDLESLLDGRRQVAGIAVSADEDLRWQIVIRLAAAGRADAQRVHAECLRSNSSDSAIRREAAALAAIPTPEAKAAAWDRITNDVSIPLATVRAMCQGENVGGRLVGGFNQRDQAKLIEPYVTQYMHAVPQLWKQRAEVVAEDITTMLFPAAVVTQRTLDETTRILKSGLPFAPKRILMEQRDLLARALKARQLDRRVQPPSAGRDGVAAA